VFWGVVEGTGLVRVVEWTHMTRCWALILSFFFQWSDIAVYVKEKKESSFEKFFNFGRTSFHGEDIPNYYSHSLIV
jgi:hypothetical protein